MKDILFDLDGTITDPMIGITKSVQYALAYYGIEVRDLKELISFIGPPLVDSFQEKYQFDEKKALEAVDKYREYFSVTGIYENEVYDGMQTFLQELKNYGYRLSIATSKPEVYAKQIIEYFNLSPYFSGIYGSELDGTRKAKADVIAYAMEKLRITAKDDVVMVGDRKHDIIGAHANHLKAIGVLYGYGDKKELEEYYADWIVSDLEELKQVILTNI